MKDLILSNSNRELSIRRDLWRSCVCLRGEIVAVMQRGKKGREMPFLRGIFKRRVSGSLADLDFTFT